ncbi:hypothetical protein CH253_08400 [Rhodococcus sp. 06-156-3C]|uniref:hypothetical protein n=1 Tax=Rhodococcus sp. 06-156-3C TaxID=2022486 RepID=UPI000B9C5335|nr:hypothetical protein [Rhodococcus sp. 06-156-3C]OZD23867.1 hypothetical protein CH253_08400 [Rhodococcus sp. 06-156-3C]
MNVVNMLTVGLLAIAVALRLPSWARPQSRPLTLALALFAVTLVLRTSALNGWANAHVEHLSGWNNLPELVSNMIRLFALLCLAMHILNAMGRNDFLPIVRRVAVVGAVLLVATYGASEAPYLDGLPEGGWSDPMAYHWLTTRVISLLTHALMVGAAFSGWGAAPRARAVLMVYQFAAFAGILHAVSHIGRVSNPGAVAMEWPGGLSLSAICLAGYACGSILNSYLKRTEPITHERIARHGVG